MKHPHDHDVPIFKERTSILSVALLIVIFQARDKDPLRGDLETLYSSAISTAGSMRLCCES
eukprot:10705999-Ditylum_brightwellii.AAC.1